MMIEKLGDQLDNKEYFKSQIIVAYQKLFAEACHCGRCENDYVTDFDNWNPLFDFNDMWKMVELLENFGYTEHVFDSAIYDFKLINFDGNNHTEYIGNGLSYNQAVANTLINFVENKKEK